MKNWCFIPLNMKRLNLISLSWVRFLIYRIFKARRLLKVIKICSNISLEHCSNVWVLVVSFHCRGGISINWMYFYFDIIAYTHYVNRKAFLQFHNCVANCYRCSYQIVYLKKIQSLAYFILKLNFIFFIINDCSHRWYVDVDVVNVLLLEWIMSLSLQNMNSAHCVLVNVDKMEIYFKICQFHVYNKNQRADYIASQNQFSLWSHLWEDIPNANSFSSVSSVSI